MPLRTDNRAHESPRRRAACLEIAHGPNLPMDESAHRAAFPAAEELRRVVPVLEQLSGAAVSIDTSKAEIAQRALELGAELVNDVTALRGDPALAAAVAESGAYLCLMHMQGEPRTMQADPRYEDVVAEVVQFLADRLTFAVSQGIREESICLDP